MENKINETFLFSSVFWGIGVLIVTFVPFFLYMKYYLLGNTQQYEKKNLFEIIAGVFIIQLFLFISYWLLATGFSILINPTPDYSPCSGIRMFFFNSDLSCDTTLHITNNLHFWKVWDFVANQNVAPSEEVIKATNIGVEKIIYFISQIYFFFAIFLISVVAIIPTIMVVRKLTHKVENRNQITPSIMGLALSYLLETIVFILLIQAHLEIGANLIRSIGNVDNFSFWNDVMSILRFVFVKGSQ